MRLDGRLGQVEAGGQFGVAQPAGQQAEDLQFARGERGEVAVEGGGVAAPLGEPLHQAAGDGGREKGVAGADRADGRGQLLGRDVLEEEAAGPGGQCRVDVTVEVEGGEDDDTGAVGERDALGSDGVGGSAVGEDAAGGLQAVHLGHPDVHQDHVGTCAADGCDRFDPVGRLTDDIDAVGAEDQPESCAYQGLVVGDEHTQRLGHGVSKGISASTRKPPVRSRPVFRVPS